MTLATVPRYEADQLTEIGDQAVVVGGSIAGLFAARVLADGFETVTVLERDPLPDKPVARDGAPQSTHPHALLEAGRATIEDLFPGFGEELFSAGGLMVDLGSQMEYYDRGGFLADAPDRLPMYCSTRALFEHVLRQRVASFEGIDLRGGCQFLDYRVDDAAERVTGVTFRDADGEQTDLTADLVVDATGRTSRTPTWLEDHGYQAPAVDEVKIDVTYSTIRIERPPNDRRMLFAPPEAPRTRGGAALPVENDQWEMILQGIHGDTAPTERDAFIEFAESLPVAELGQIAAENQWISDGIHHYPFPSNIRRRYEKLTEFPAGLVVTGDAIASFNPIYGQGMSVAALDALLLHHALADGGLDDLAPRFFDATAEVGEMVWQLAVGRDFEFPQTTGPKPPGSDLTNRYVARLIRKAHDDGGLTEAFYRVFRLEQPPTTLMHPRVMLRVLRPTWADLGVSSEQVTLDVPRDEPTPPRQEEPRS